MKKSALLASFLALLTLGVGTASNGTSPEEKVDRRTQDALALDAHPAKGGDAYRRYCSRCHGTRAHGSAQQEVPALAGQRYAYLIRQLANFAGSERDNSKMHAVTAQPELRQPQMWADIASYLNALPGQAPLTTGPGNDVALGRGIFHEQCAGCHGAD